MNIIIPFIKLNVSIANELTACNPIVIVHHLNRHPKLMSNDIVEGDDVGHNYMPQYHSEQSADTIYQLDNSNDLSQYFTN
jgi:hypothetical protein